MEFICREILSPKDILESVTRKISNGTFGKDRQQSSNEQTAFSERSVDQGMREHTTETIQNELIVTEPTELKESLDYVRDMAAVLKDVACKFVDQDIAL